MGAEKCSTEAYFLLCFEFPGEQEMGEITHHIILSKCKKIAQLEISNFPQTYCSRKFYPLSNSTNRNLTIMNFSSKVAKKSSIIWTC